MNEIAKCPLCGKNPDVYHAMTSPGQRLLVKIECCDHAVASPLSLIEKWNQYAAAMELARELVKLERCEVICQEYYRLEKSIAQMEYHVIEAFGGE